MSNERFKTKEEAYEDLRAQWPEDASVGFHMAEYTDENVDMLAVWDAENSTDGPPLFIVPTSDRAKSTFIRWGMDDWSTAIKPPEDAMDLIKSIPGDWRMGKADINLGAHIIQEITLPPPLSVVH